MIDLFESALDATSIWTLTACFFLALLTIQLGAIQFPFLIWSRRAHRRSATVYRIEPRKGQAWREFKNDIASLAVESVVFASLVKSGWGQFESGHIVVTVIAGLVWLDIWFYFAHLALHSRWLFRWHRLHHTSMVSTPMSALSFSVVEGLVIIVGYLAGMVVISYWTPLTFAGLFLHIVVINHIFNTLGHSNVELVPPGSPFNGTTFHAMHHARFSGNYGLLTPILDRVFGTQFPDYREVHEHVHAGGGLRHFTDRFPIRRRWDRRANRRFDPITIPAPS